MSKSNTIICAAKKCYSSIVTHPCKSFFGFPSDISLCKIWLENCGRTDLNLKQVSKRSHWRLCDDHFEDKWFTDCSRTILKRKLNPVPTIFLNNINSLLPSGTEPDSIDDDSTLDAADSLCGELVEDGSCEDICNLTEPSLKKKRLPISYNSEQLLKSVDFSTKTASKTAESLDPDTELLHKIDEMCRFCMNKVSLNFIEMFSETDDAKEIRKVSEIILPNKISICDGLPHKVCQQCTDNLKTCRRLIEQFQNADRYLRAIAKYSLYIENEDTTEISLDKKDTEDEINDSYFVKPIPKNAMVLPLSPFKNALEGSYDYLGEINVAAPVDMKNNFNFCSYVVASNSGDLENSIWQERSINEGAVNKMSSNFKKHKQILDHNSKFKKKYKKMPPQEFKNGIIFLTQDNLSHDPTVLTTYQMSNFGIVDPIEEIIFTGHKCTQCSELFNSVETLEQHFKSIHDT